MADTVTTTLGLTKPEVGASEDSWGEKINTNFDLVDDALDGTTAVSLDINGGTIDGAVIGGATPAAGTFTTLTANTSLGGTLSTAAQPNVTSVGTLTGLTVSASASLAGASTSADITFGDNDKAIFGAGSDLQIYHDGLASYIDEQGSGDLRIRGTSMSLKTSDNETYALFAANGASVLYYDNAAKLATTSTGIDVTGTVEAHKVEIGDGSGGGTSEILFSDNVSARGKILYDHSSNPETMLLQTTGTTAISIDNVQNVSIPNGNLDITGTLTSDGLTVEPNTGLYTTDATISNYSSSNGVYINGHAGGWLALRGDGTGFTRWTLFGGTTGNATLHTNNKNRITVDGGTGDISFYEDTGTTPKFFWDASDQELEITSTGVHGLHLRQQDDNTANSSRLFFDNATNIWTAYSTNGYFKLASNATIGTSSGTDRFVIDSSGNVGIGTSSPSARLHVTGGSARLVSGGSGGIFGDDNTSYFIVQASPTANAASIYFNGQARSGFESQLHYGASNHVFYNESLSAERMRIDSSGNLLVGKTSSSASTTGAELQKGSGGQSALIATAAGTKVGIINRTTSDGDIIEFRKDNTTVGSIGNISSNIYIGNADTGLGVSASSDTLYPISVTSGAIRDGAIDLGISAARFKDLYLSGDSFVGEPSTIGAGETGVTVRGLGQIRVGRSGTASATLVSFNNSNGEVGRISTSGSATSYVTSSDYRLKTDAQPMTGATDRLKQLNPVNFEWIADGTRVDGFLAHEAQAIVPEAVTGTKDAMRDEEYEVTPAVLDDDGNVVTEAVIGTRSVPDYQGIDQSKLVPLLTAALQEALTKIDALETRITALEG